MAFQKKTIMVFFIFLSTFACTKKSYIDMYYTVPLQSNLLDGKEIYLEIKDLRKDKMIFTDKAKESFNFFTGLFSLTLKEEKQSNLLLGAYELPALYHEIFKQRLKKLGAEILDDKNRKHSLEVVLKEFKIDLVNHRWIADVSYEASLIKDTQILSKEVVRGKVERFKLIGSKEAEVAISELFTDIINKLDVDRLFAQIK